jgi:IS30 family transposase
MGAPRKQHDWREERRFRAWSLKQAGWKQKAIAQALGVSEAAVSHWLKRGANKESLPSRVVLVLAHSPSSRATRKNTCAPCSRKRPQPSDTMSTSGLVGGWPT